MTVNDVDRRLPLDFVYQLALSTVSLGDKQCLLRELKAVDEEQGCPQDCDCTDPRVCRCARWNGGQVPYVAVADSKFGHLVPVSYTHLTLPTKRIVEISVGVGQIKKKIQLNK
eukprot:TRINITY_DN39236_c0_g1_i1.p2 TRINITY_DN39236_c0_g1~~TRINITY_DN39236_c0_g1_i1.p2  ORF type:complete len:113 (+),score=18.24 TRINITY_DN39236_c0_g1_i1:388-726(+)